MKYIILALTIVFLGLTATAQYRPSFPDENGLKVKEDYPPFEPTVVAAASWLVETDAATTCCWYRYTSPIMPATAFSTSPARTSWSPRKRL